jgi:ubiquinone/menaquinone biosynthesis C-methylase UbiE
VFKKGNAFNEQNRGGWKYGSFVPDQILLEKTYTQIAKIYSKSVYLINTSNKLYFIKNLSNKRNSMLDIGCGARDLLLSLSKYFEKSYDVDPVSSFVSIAKKKPQNRN